MTLAQLSKGVDTAIRNIIHITGRAMEATKEVAEDAQRDQMLHGKDKNNNPIGRYRNGMYAIEKYRQSPLAGLGQADLKLTGAFHKGIFLKIQGDTFSLYSTDSKADKLTTKYGDRIWDLSVPYKAQWIPALSNAMVRELNIVIYGK